VDWITAHWPWIGTPITLLSGLLWRRKNAGSIWRRLVQQFRLNKRITELEMELAASNVRGDFAIQALRDVTEAAALVKTAHDQGYLRTNDPSSSKRSTTPDSSTTSPGTLRGPLGIP
jgi:hypothetical protein